ncbi:MAG: glutamine--fructose-6-phosphate transaminase (isomerizing) [Paludibacteraceae bacterium]|nr:glutamine--fructose-6-phosphate transaminase (isomerizing) [Paludibacteraceae bacterium]
MCGIVGYIGHTKAFPILIKGLHRLEYRGYDSAGVAMISPSGQLNVYKAIGKVAELERATLGKDVEGTVGIAHTRWATHGEPSERNAHPHYSQSKQLAMVHNGIIENYESIRQRLQKEEYHFVSDTDTEVLVQLIEYVKITNGLSLLQAVEKALQQVTGAYSIAVLDKETPNQIIAARKGSPLVIGVGKDDFFLASDATPIVEYTKDVIYVGDEEVVDLTLGQKPHIYRLDGTELTYEIKHLVMTIDELEKGGFEHYMLKEIFEQPNTIRASLQEPMQPHIAPFCKAKRIIICACGTSWHAGLIAKYAIEQIARIPCEVDYSSEFRYRNPVLSSDDILIAISQSGETADTLAAIELAHQYGTFVFSVCNVVGSSIPRASNDTYYTHVGPEIGVASTKAFTAQVMALTLLALEVGRVKETLTDERYLHLMNEYRMLPDKIEAVLQQNDRIREYAPNLKDAVSALYLGHGYNFPIALEGALKMKEISYIHAEGYPSAEMKHGPIALISSEMPVVAIAPQCETYEKVVSNIRVVKARQGRIISVVTEGDTQVSAESEFTMTIPHIDECLSPILTVIPLQLLAYHVAVVRGCNVDQPRNLAKSVTVE